MTNINGMPNTYNYIYRADKSIKLVGPILYAIVILCCFFVHRITGSMVFFVGGLAVLLIAWLLLSWEKMLLVIGILIPSVMMIKLNGTKYAILGYFLLLTALKCFLQSGFAIKLPVVFIFHAACVCITAGMYQQWSEILNPLIRTVVFFVFICTLSRQEVFATKRYKEQLIKSFLLGLCLAVFFGMLDYYLLGDNRSFLSGMKNDRNYFSSMLITGLSIIPLYATKKNKVEAKILLAAAMLLYGGLLTYSRTFFIALIAVALLWIVKFNIWRQWKQLLAISVVVVIIGVLLGDRFAEVLDRLMARFGTEDAKGGNGRLEAWVYYLKLTASSIARFFFGNGRATAYISRQGMRHVEHNTFIEMLSTVGVLGTATLLSSYYTVSKKLLSRVQKIQIVDLLTWLPFLICYSGISAMYSDAFNFQFFITLVAIGYVREKEMNVLGPMNPAF